MEFNSGFKGLITYAPFGSNAMMIETTVSSICRNGEQYINTKSIIYPGILKIAAHLAPSTIEGSWQ